MAGASAPPLRPWRADLLDMAAAPGGASRCVLAHVCWPCLAGEVAERTGGSYLLDGLVCGTFGCVYCVYWIPWTLTRARLRARLGIAGSLAEDCVVAGILSPCYLTQALNELDFADGGAGARAAVQPLPQHMEPRVLRPEQLPPGGGGGGGGGGERRERYDRGDRGGDRGGERGERRERY